MELTANILCCTWYTQPITLRSCQVEDLFSKYGRIVEIDLKLPPRPPGFAFVEFEHTRDAQDAVDGRDGYDFYGSRLRVSFSPDVAAGSHCQDRRLRREVAPFGLNMVGDVQSLACDRSADKCVEKQYILCSKRVVSLLGDTLRVARGARLLLHVTRIGCLHFIRRGHGSAA